jgi:hypothetical protein
LKISGLPHGHPMRGQPFLKFLRMLLYGDVAAAALGNQAL